MPKITRKTQKIFAGSASNNGVFGSAQLGTKVLSNDPDTIQGLAAWDNGWNDATISGERLPTLEEMQGIQFVQTRQLSYLLQEGIPEFDLGTTYYENSIVKEAGTYKLYGSLTDNNVGNLLSDGAEWELLIDFSDLDTGGEPVNGSYNNMTISRASATTVTISIQQLVLQDSAGDTVRGTALSHTLNCATTGANGLDTGALGASTFYYVFEIYNPTTDTFASLASTTAPAANGRYAGANMPAGYTFSAHTSCFLTNGSSQILAYYQTGRTISFPSIQIFSNLTPVPGFLTSQSISAVVPPLAKTVSGIMSMNFTSGALVRVQVASDASGTGLQDGAASATSTITNGVATYLSFKELAMITAQTIFINFGNTATGSTNSLLVNGYTF